MTTNNHDTPKTVTRSFGLLAGLLPSLLLLIFADLAPGQPSVTRAAAIAVLMAVWWITEAIPLAMTALIPVVLFPALGVMPGNVVAESYFNSTIFLFVGGFLIALAMQEWELHRRIALRILIIFGAKPSRTLLGFMIATAFLSMWISNTAATMMMVPIALAIIINLERLVGETAVCQYGLGILLSIAYSASIGGITTLVGTPPNMSFVRIFAIYFPDAPEISFARWFFFALPVTTIFLTITWVYLTARFCPQASDFSVDAQVFHDEYSQLGPITFEEKIVLIHFIGVAILWLFRADVNVGFVTIPGWSSLFPVPGFVNDGTVAIAIAVSLFAVPSRQKRGRRILGQDAIGRLPWGIILLFGGGFALAGGFKESGLSTWVGAQLAGLGSVHPLLMVLLICLTLTFLTQLTSNTASTEMLLPILAALAVTLNINPLFLMVPATLSCSCAFMLPVATPPNAIVFGSERIPIREMARTGFALNLIGALLITAAIYGLGPTMLDVTLDVMPDWATSAD